MKTLVVANFGPALTNVVRGEIMYIMNKGKEPEEQFTNVEEVYMDEVAAGLDIQERVSSMLAAYIGTFHDAIVHVLIPPIMPAEAMLVGQTWQALLSQPTPNQIFAEPPIHLLDVGVVVLHKVTPQSAYSVKEIV